jgi:hypothetical protein
MHPAPALIFYNCHTTQLGVDLPMAQFLGTADGRMPTLAGEGDRRSVRRPPVFARQGLPRQGLLPRRAPAVDVLADRRRQPSRERRLVQGGDVNAPYFGLENPRLPSPGLLSRAGVFAGAQATGQSMP